MRLPRRARHLVGQAYNADKLQDIFLRAGIHGWEVYERADTPGNDLCARNVMMQFHHVSTYVPELNLVHAKMRPLYAAWKLWRFEKARPYSPSYTAVIDLEEFARAAQERLEQGAVRPVDRLFWRIDQVYLPRVEDDGSPRPHVWVEHGKIAEINIR